MPTLNRRKFIRSLGSVTFIGSVLGISTANAQSTVTVTGRVISSSGEVRADNVVKLVETQSEEVFVATTDSNGEFQLDVPGNSEYLINYIQSSTPAVVPDRPDDIPSHYLVRSISIGSDSKDLGTIELPRAHRVEARVVGANDRPIEGAVIQIRSKGFGLPPGTFTTNREGYIKHSGAEHPGVDLTGPVQIGAWPPGEQMGGRPPALKRVLVDKKRSLTLNLEGVNAETPSGSQQGGTTSTVQADDADGSTGKGGDERQRGFLSNSGDEPAILSNVFSLTMLGFVMSAAGLIYQMMEGR